MNCKDSWGHTPLHRSVCVGDVETAALLCAIGADVNSPDVEQRTPLMWAANNQVSDLPCSIRRGGREIPCNWRVIPCNI